MTRPRPARARWLRPLKPLSQAYGWIISQRNRRYDAQRGVTQAGVPVISVGNITVGGTGKTPLVLELVRRLLDLDRRPAILTRGYGAKQGQIADEVQEFQAEQPEVPVVVDSDRVRGADVARRKHQADVLLMDDGFQHRRLGRDLDLVLIDAWNPWGGDVLLPAGRLREPLTSLRRAHLICISRANQVDAIQLAAIRSRLSEIAPGVPLISSHVEPRNVFSHDDQILSRETLSNSRLQPICGLGNPVTFAALCNQLSHVARTPLMFPDHHNYSKSDARAILQAASERGVDLLVTTRKDWGKLKAVWPTDASIPLARVEMDVRVIDEEHVLEQTVNRILERKV